MIWRHRRRSVARMGGVLLYGCGTPSLDAGHKAVSVRRGWGCQGPLCSGESAPQRPATTSDGRRRSKTVEDGGWSRRRPSPTGPRRSRDHNDGIRIRVTVSQSVVAAVSRWCHAGVTLVSCVPCCRPLTLAELRGVPAAGSAGAGVM